MERGRLFSAAPVPAPHGLFILPIADIQPDCRTYNEYDKHNRNNGLSIHSLILLFLSALKADKTENACTNDTRCRNSSPEGRIEVIACFRGVTQLIVHRDCDRFIHPYRYALVGRQDIGRPSMRISPFLSVVKVWSYPVIPNDTERESLHFTVRGSLDDFE